MQLIENDNNYDALAREFVIRYIEKTATLLNGQDIVPFEVNSLTPDARELLFNLCFIGIASFEEKSGINLGEDKFTPRPTFELKRNRGDGELLVGARYLHELVEESIPDGLERMRMGFM